MAPDWQLATTGKGDLSNLALLRNRPARARWARGRSAFRYAPPG